jgi:protein-S-isoprenylcysteine O-methyltransferase Ste14
LTLGGFWSGSVTLKPEHRVIDRGPFALVRHPIYTGFIFTAFCMAFLRGTAVNFLGAFLIAFGFWLKARLEERFLRAALGAADYDAYAARTPMLVPWLRASRAKT